MKSYWVGLALTALLSFGVEAAKILVFIPLPLTSHHQFFRPLVRELTIRGHDVTFLTPFKMENMPPNYKEILIKDRKKDVMELLDLETLGERYFWSFTNTLYKMAMDQAKWTCSLPAVQALLQSNTKFDAVITESLFLQEPYSAIAHKFGAADIELTSMGSVAWMNHIVGNPHNPSYMLDFKSRYTVDMNFAERIHNTAVMAATVAIGWYYMPEFQKLSDECLGYGAGAMRPPLGQLLSSKSLVLVNSHPSVNYPEPMAPHVKQVAGLHIRPPSPVTEDLQTYMDEATDGFIYFSLGSNLQVSGLLKSNFKRSFVNVFKFLNQKILWKWESDFEDKPDNAIISKWFPQQDILAHKNCKLFITHGGFLSMTEAVNYGVPTIGIPFYGDQWKNIKHASLQGYGIHLEFNNITEISVAWAVEEMLENPKYREAAQLSSKLFKDRPVTAMDEAIFWIEHVVKYKGAEYLRPISARLPWYKTMLLDVFIFCALIGILALTMLYVVIKVILSIIFKKDKSKLKIQ